jgi:hypothetical protein
VEAAAVVEVVAGAAAVAAGVRENPMTKQKFMSCSLIITAGWLITTAPVWASSPAPQRNFASAEEAASALVAALRDQNEADLRAILGPEADRVVDSGDRYADRELHQRFVALFDQKHTIDQKSSTQAELDVGPDDWPLPIPLVQSNGRWSFA